MPFLLGNAFGSLIRRSPFVRFCSGPSVHHSSLTDTVSYLMHPSRRVVLIGTAHISDKSADEVKSMIETHRPDCVMVELCPRRFKKFTADDADEPSAEVTIENFMNGKLGNIGVFEGLMRKAYDDALRSGGQREKLGVEVKAAVETAQSLSIPVLPFDRPIEKTMEEIKAVVMSFQFMQNLVNRGLQGGSPQEQQMMQMVQRAQSSQSFDLSSFAEQMKTRSAATDATAVMKKSLPDIHNILITKRDRYMVSALKNLNDEFQNIVAVVGMGHMDGMEKEWLEAMKDVPGPQEKTQEIKLEEQEGKV